MKTFISYSHQDERNLARLHKHLAMLRRDGLLTTWYDREILAGAELHKEIAENLADSDVFLALVSPDFLASDYCYDKEVHLALKRHEDGSIRLIPIILEPCDWRNSPLANLKALPKDGQPISLWANENVAFLDIATELRRVMTAPPKGRATSKASLQLVREARRDEGARRYRIKRDFDRIDRDEFRHQAFGTIREYFQRSIAELNGIGDPIRARFESMGETAFTCTVLNKAKQGGEANITVHEHGMMGGLTYSFARRARDNTANGFLTVEANEYDLNLKMDAFSTRGDHNGLLSPAEAAQRLWAEFLGQGGISDD